MKKILSFILVTVMLLALGTSAFAAENFGEGFDIRKSVAPDNFNYSRSVK